VDFEFPKGFLATAQLAQVQDVIGRIFSIDGSPNAPAQEAQVASAVSEPAPPAALPVAPLKLPSTYVCVQTPAIQLQLNPDNSFLLQEDGQNYHGAFVASGDTLELNISENNIKTILSRQGSGLTDSNGQTWVLREQSALAASGKSASLAEVITSGGTVPPLAAPAGGPLRLPSTYVNAQSPEDRLHLNVDNSFSLQEAGQTYRGVFAVNGNTLEINTPDTNTKTTMTIQDGNLTDPSGQLWAGQGQFAPTVSSTFSKPDALRPSNWQPNAIFETTSGKITCTLFPDKAPMTVDNFISLATGSKIWTDPATGAKKIGVPLYDGTIFHRVIPDFMIQGGDPQGNGVGGPGYKFKDEFSDLRFDRPGRLAMANSGPDTNGSRFFITAAAVPFLNTYYTIFGQCESMDVIHNIISAPTNRSDRPDNPIRITHITIAQ
jgi:peptidyl-prolyl cis-trans isomerase A (cyclophilin A)